MVFLKFPVKGGYETIKEFLQIALLHQDTHNLSTSDHTKYYFYVPAQLSCRGKFKQISIINSAEYVWDKAYIEGRDKIQNKDPAPHLKGYINFLDTKKMAYLKRNITSDYIMTNLTYYFEIIVDRDSV
jgi:hypothetical protein